MTADHPLGMDRHTGQPITDLRTHVVQSINDILTTLVGSRVERRDYGSVLPLLIDQPLHDATMLRAYSAAIVAIQQWEPRARVERIQRQADGNHPGQVTFRLIAVTDDGRASIDVDMSEARA